MKIQSTNTSFTGYSNIFTHHTKEPVGKFSILVAKLDDIGKADLSEFKKIKTMQGLSSKEIEDDVLTVIYSNILHKFRISLGENKIMSGEELLSMQDKSINSAKKAKYKHQKDISLKTHTFLADLTRRMMNDYSGEKRDKEFWRVLKTAHKKLAIIFDSFDIAFEYMNESLLKNKVEFPKIAKDLNDEIDESMKIFLLN